MTLAVQIFVFIGLAVFAALSVIAAMLSAIEEHLDEIVENLKHHESEPQPDGQ